MKESLLVYVVWSVIAVLFVGGLETWFLHYVFVLLGLQFGIGFYIAFFCFLCIFCGLILWSEHE